MQARRDQQQATGAAPDAGEHGSTPPSSGRQQVALTAATGSATVKTLAAVAISWRYVHRFPAPSISSTHLPTASRPDDQLSELHTEPAPCHICMCDLPIELTIGTPQPSFGCRSMQMSWQFLREQAPGQQDAATCHRQSVSPFWHSSNDREGQNSDMATLNFCCALPAQLGGQGISSSTMRALKTAAPSRARASRTLSCRAGKSLL